MCEFDEGRKVHFEYLPVTSEEFKNNKIGTSEEEQNLVKHKKRQSSSIQSSSLTPNHLRVTKCFQEVNYPLGMTQTHNESILTEYTQGSAI